MGLHRFSLRFILAAVTLAALVMAVISAANLREQSARRKCEAHDAAVERIQDSGAYFAETNSRSSFRFVRHINRKGAYVATNLTPEKLVDLIPELKEVTPDNTTWTRQPALVLDFTDTPQIGLAAVSYLIEQLDCTLIFYELSDGKKRHIASKDLRVKKLSDSIRTGRR